MVQRENIHAEKTAEQKVKVVATSGPPKEEVVALSILSPVIKDWRPQPFALSDAGPFQSTCFFLVSRPVDLGL